MRVERRQSGRGRIGAWARAAALALGCALAPSVVLAQTEIPAEIFVVLAADTPGTIDARLSGMPGLRQPPFDGFGSMLLLDLHAASLAVGAPHDVTLPNGRVLRIVIEGVTDEGRFRVRVVINRPGETDYLPLLTMLASPGLPFFVAGQRLDSGALIIAIRLGASTGASGMLPPPLDVVPAAAIAPSGERGLVPFSSACVPGCVPFSGWFADGLSPR